MSASIAIAIVLGLSSGGCSSLKLPLPCDLKLVALPADSSLQVGEPLPADTQVLAGPAEFDPAATAVVDDANGNPAVDLELRGDAIPRVGAYTADHIGERMAMAINGVVVAVPVIQAAMPDGSIQISAGFDEGDELASKFSGCVG
jgi:preprotein translocase subunit SecD